MKAIKGLASPSATAIARITIPMVMDAIREIDGDDVDAIIQCGTNLSAVDIFPTMEHWLQKPVIPINIACVWHAPARLRDSRHDHRQGPPAGGILSGPNRRAVEAGGTVG